MLRRLVYSVALIGVVALGLLLRRMLCPELVRPELAEGVDVAFLPNETGDALWVIAVYCFYRIIWCRLLLSRIAFYALLTAYAVEFSQLIRWDWLVALRSTTIGHLFLGQGFLLTDLLAYTIGVITIYVITYVIERFWLK